MGWEENASKSQVKYSMEFLNCSGQTVELAVPETNEIGEGGAPGRSDLGHGCVARS